MDGKRWLARNLAVFGVSALVSLFASVLRLVLASAGDQVGQALTYGMFLTGLVVASGSLIVQVVLLTLTQLDVFPNLANDQGPAESSTPENNATSQTLPH